MKRLLLVGAAFLAFGFSGGCVADKHVDAGTAPHTEVSVSNEELIRLSRDLRARGDAEAAVAADRNKYAVRLARLSDRFKNEDGLDLNFKAYITPEVNANATADGSIRIYSGLMDMMTDNELIFIIGHEIGHVKNGASLDKVRMAYGSSGLVKAAAGNTPAGAALVGTQLGDLLDTVLNARFSQKQESDADAYGYRLMRKYKLDTKAAVSALMKLESLGSSGGLTASHPNSYVRAGTVQAMIDADAKQK